MKSYRSPDFRELFERLPTDIQKVAVEKFHFWKANPHHPSLHFKPVGRYWSVRINRDYRALCLRSKETCVWFWVGTHSEYDKLL